MASLGLASERGCCRQIAWSSQPLKLELHKLRNYFARLNSDQLAFDSFKYLLTLFPVYLAANQQ